MIEHIILGIIQGIAEWLPVSSEGLIVLAKTHLFQDARSIDIKIQLALYLHLGTTLAAIIYFRKDVASLIKTIGQYSAANSETKKTFDFLILSTVISGTLGLAYLKILTTFAGQFESSSSFINILIGFCLLGTAFLELKAKKSGYKHTADLKMMDGILMGFVQSLAVFPGLSRSGLTVSALLLRKFDKTDALRLSFLMSIPIVLLGNVFLSLTKFSSIQFSFGSLAGLGCAFIFGLATIHILLKVAQKVNFGYFVLGFGLLTIGTSFI